MTERLEKLGLKRTYRDLQSLPANERYRLEKICRGLRLPRHLYDALSSLADELGITKNLLMEFALQDFVNVFDADPEFRTPLFKMTFKKRLEVNAAKWSTLAKEMQNIKRNSRKPAPSGNEKASLRKKP